MSDVKISVELDLGDVAEAISHTRTRDREELLEFITDIDKGAADVDFTICMCLRFRLRNLAGQA